MTAGSRKIILKAWCNPATTHHVGDMHFLPDGSLMVSSGDGSFYDYADEGYPPNTFTAVSGAAQNVDIPQYCRFGNPETGVDGGSWYG